MAVKCLECGKELANERALAGHLYGIHGRRIGLRVDVQKAKDDAEMALLMSQNHTERLVHFLNEVEGRLSRLEQMLSEIEWRERDGCAVLDEDGRKAWSALLSESKRAK